MSLNESLHYGPDGALYVDEVPAALLAHELGTPAYVYSLRRILHNYQQIRQAFAPFHAHIHYSAKANANLSILRALVEAGAGIDAVSGGEIARALRAGASAEQIVFAGVGKSPEEIRYATAQGIGWFNVENEAELGWIQEAAHAAGRQQRIALRLNPDVTANTHPYIATGHGAAKFGLSADRVQHLLAHQADYPNLRFAGIHVHIGSQLHDTQGTLRAVQSALEIIRPYPGVRTLNIGGGFPAAYRTGEVLPAPQDFAEALRPLIQNYDLILEPGRSIVADAGMLLCRVLYVKEHAGQCILIVDASMTELIRPALYQAAHEIIPLQRRDGPVMPAQVVGPVCESADMLGKDVLLPAMRPGDLLAVLTVGAYGMVMASNYNARPRPAEALVRQNGAQWELIRRRETFEAMLEPELL